MLSKIKAIALVLVSSAFILVSFQNCSEDVQFSELKLGSLGVCGTVSCDLDPLTSKIAVTTILIALGDEANSQLVVNGASSQLIAETVVRYTSPVNNPKILLVNDFSNGGESPEDTTYVRNVLLGRYNVDFIQDSSAGLTDDDVKGYDLIWFNNPGHPMGSSQTLEVLKRFPGAIVMQGDDLTRGNGFFTEELTGLRFIDNGTSVTCNGTSYAHDNNLGEQFRVTLDPSKIPGADNSTINFRYGNDIDNSEIVRSDLEVLAVAQGGPAECTELRPAIVRYTKN